METIVFYVVLPLIFWVMPALIVSSEVCTGKPAYAFAICILCGPLGIIIVLSIEYAKTVFIPKKKD